MDRMDGILMIIRKGLWSFSESINQSINQSIDRSINQSITSNQSIIHSFIQTNKQPIPKFGFDVCIHYNENGKENKTWSIGF